MTRKRKKPSRKRTPKHVRMEVGLDRSGWWVTTCRVDDMGFYDRTKAAALRYARGYARLAYKTKGHCTTIKVKNRDGRYADEITIPRSSDPFPPRG